ncbi:MAG TPA: phage Gp37/Gp68 family protein [Bosea sp. (in: a-proteobacteria)]|jgi:protein gp37|uniref:DUF5131 family protein n=1 Tax=Bosea sp. (in: a-proteobacteria) TaxID=1871050 RepID=UPI002DDCE2D9|nr:phage Gp37/Gp68 family protein [Bosea sp. (in: a-proteobacteria)]HEV2552748.1 phage Gp37/Gp68 family protein [Bosea sp. (in: a-proteobacteria)]
MADRTGIEWTDASWNPVVGCSLVSPGCTNCYAMGQAARIVRCSEGLGRASTYDGTVETVKGKPVWTGKVALASEATLTQPLRWKRPRRIFVNSMGDIFHEDVPDEWIDRVFAVMALAPQHTFQILTKRAARMRGYFEKVRHEGGICDSMSIIWQRAVEIATERDLMAHYQPQLRVLPNVWLGVSAEDQRRADERIPDLLATPAAIRFVSAEPLLGPIDFGNRQDGLPSNAWLTWLDDLDWTIVGGESGPNARPMHPDWARSIRDQCAAAGTAFFFKQWGEWSPHTAALEDDDGGIRTSPRGGVNWQAEKPGGAFGVFRVGKARAGRLLDGVAHDAMPSCSGLSRASTPSTAEAPHG